MKKLLVCGSSFLLPNNKSWDMLEKNYTLKFAEYGNIGETLFKANAKDIVLIVIFFEDIIKNINEDSVTLSKKFSSLINSISYRCSQSNQPTLVCWGKNFGTNPIRLVKNKNQENKVFDCFEKQFKDLLQKHKSLYFLNLNDVFSKKGYENIFDVRNWYFSHCRLSLLGISTLATTVNSILNRHFNSPAKVLILDCDNTIWGGVVGEDGLEGIMLGQDGIGTAFLDFQKEVKKLSENGVILAISSKNNEKEVWDIFDNHPSMILKKKDFVSWRINWNEKSENIKSISQELDLSLDSFVFWDDNPIERNKARSFLPEVFTVEMESDVFKWPEIIKNLDCFSNFEVTEDDRKKTVQYHGRAKFVRDSLKISNIYDYLRGINLTPLASNLNDGLIGRAVQLCLKTNQYNFRTIRHNAKDLMGFKEKNSDFCFLVSLTDNYGDHGIVALVCLEALDKKSLFINTFLMSCRVLGRFLEAWILNEIVRRAKKHGFKDLVGEFVATDRNIVAKDFFNTYGFKEMDIKSEFYNKLKQSSIISGKKVFFSNIKNLKITNLEIYEKI
jgi:FkbH-like protein